MPDRADYLLDKYFINNIIAKTEKRIGAEIELPLVRMDRRPLETEFVLGLMEHMRSYGFTPISETEEGYCYKAKNEEGDEISFDTTWNIIEFSIRPELSVLTLASRFYGYIETAQQFTKPRGYIICGRGLHPYAEYIDVSHLNTDMYRAKADFLRNFTTHRDGDIFFAIPASTQTHIDCPASEFPEVFNLLRSFVFIDACLFANSLPPSEALIEKHRVLERAARATYCFRDEIYRLSEAPNTAQDDRKFTTLDDVREYLRKLKIFIVKDEEYGYKPIKPTPFEAYFGNDENPEEDMVCFRPLEPVSVSKYGTFELRGACTQSMSEIFQPVAFYTGLVEMRGRASELLSDFLEKHRICMKPMELRRRIAQGEKVADEKELQDFLRSIAACAYDGLIKRGLSEERLISGIYGGDEASSGGKELKTPAQRELELREAGVPLPEIIRILT